MVLRTSRDGCWDIKDSFWGRYLAPAVDPLADTVITDEQLEGFEIRADVPKIPTALWQRWIALCFEFCGKSNRELEVSCRLLRKTDDPSVYRILVPVQKVSMASVRVDTFDKAIDIVTGETVQQYPPPGWTPCGSSHSHNTMDAFFSGTDDKYELGDPGLHIVVGQINKQLGTFKLAVSITANLRRFLIEPADVLELSDVVPDVTFHPNVLTAVSFPSAPGYTTALSTPLSYNSPWPTTDHYDSFPSTYSSRRVDLAPVQDYVNEFNAATQRLIDAARAVQLDPAEVLRQMSWDLDDQAYEASSDPLLADPFWYSV